MCDESRERARQVGVPYVCLSDTKPTNAALAIVPLNIARRYCALPLAIEDNTLTVAMADPRDAEALAILATTANLSIFPVLGSTAEIAAALDQWAQRPPSDSIVPRSDRIDGTLRVQRRRRRHVPR